MCVSIDKISMYSYNIIFSYNRICDMREKEKNSLDSFFLFLSHFRYLMPFHLRTAGVVAR